MRQTCPGMVKPDPVLVVVADVAAPQIDRIAAAASFSTQDLPAGLEADHR